MPETDLNAASNSRTRATQSGTSVSRNFNVAVAMLVLLTMVVFWLISYYNLQNLLRQQADSLGPKLAQQAAILVTDQVLTNDLISMNVLLNQLTRDSVIAEAAVLNIDGGTIAVSRANVAPPPSLIPLTPVFGEYSAPIALQDSVAGEVRLRLDLSYIEVGILNNLLFVSAATALIMVVAVSLSSTYFQYLVIFPLRLLAYSLQRIRRGEIETIPEMRHYNEMSKTIRQFNATAEFLDQATFINVMKERLQEMQGDDDSRLPAAAAQRIEVTVACIRISNFEYLASTHDERKIVALLNRYYFYVEKVSALYNGTISYCADGEIIVGFTAAQLEDDQSFYAICAAQLLLSLSDAIADTGAESSSLNLKLRIGIHAGDSVANLYSPMTGRQDQVMGRVVDLAREICDECPDDSLLISEKVYLQAGAETRVQGLEFSVVDDEYAVITWLCNEPMTGIGNLLQRQAEALLQIASQSAAG